MIVINNKEAGVEKPAKPKILCKEGLTFQKNGVDFWFVQIAMGVYKVYEKTSPNRYTDQEFGYNLRQTYSQHI